MGGKSKAVVLTNALLPAHARRVIELRRDARTWEEIGLELGVTPTEAQTIARAAYVALVADDVDQLRTEAELRLEALFREALTEIKFAATGNAKQGAIALALKIETRRAQLLGLDRRAGE
jgi:hypothetical protein